MKYQVTIQEGNEATQVEIEATLPRLAWELALSHMGFAPHKFNTTMDIELSNTRRVVYISKGFGELVLTGLVKECVVSSPITQISRATDLKP